MRQKNDDIPTLNKSVEIYLESAVIRGTLVTKHRRLSDHLNMGTIDQFLSLQDAKLEALQGKSHQQSSKSIILNLQRILLVSDLDSGEVLNSARKNLSWVNREPLEVVMGVGSFWVRGNLHLIHGGDLSTFTAGKSLFIPLTSATFLDSPEAQQQTFLVNREKINCIANC
ncbi:MAG: hypothetical protein ACE5HC_07850 [Candidatus Binatia bacterium]